MNTISRAAQLRRSGIPLGLVVLFSLILGTHGCTLIGPISLGCEDIPITVTPGSCTSFQAPECFGAFAGEGAVIEATGANGQYAVIGDENNGFQFCAVEGAAGTSEPERVAYMVTGGPGRFGRGNFLVTVEGLVDATVSDSPDPVIVGSDLTYTITLTNRRQAPTSFIEFVDRLPASVSLVSSLPSNCDLQNNEIACREITIAAGASVTYQFVVRPTTPGEITNELNLFDPVLTNPLIVTNTTTVNPVSGADLAVTITDNPDPVIRGGLLTYTVTVTNHGPAAATGVQLDNPLPPLEIFNIVVSQGSFTTPDFAYILCDFGTLAPGASATLTFNGAAGLTGTIFNTATATANETDPNPANNSASESTTVNPP